VAPTVFERFHDARSEEIFLEISVAEGLGTGELLEHPKTIKTAIRQLIKFRIISLII
jgi:hypothetical protein